MTAMRDITPMDSVREFHKAFNAPIGIPFKSGEDLSLRLRLITEEYDELRAACINAVFSQEKTKTGLPTTEALADVTKELCDLLYVCYRLAVTFNLPVIPAFNRVHKSNMSKLGDDGKPIYREDGKVLKGPNYWAPDLEDLFE